MRLKVRFDIQETNKFAFQRVLKSKLLLEFKLFGQNRLSRILPRGNPRESREATFPKESAADNVFSQVVRRRGYAKLVYHERPPLLCNS
jgi:hypothetical protein